MKIFVDKDLGDTDDREGLKKYLADYGCVLDIVGVAGKKINPIRASLSIGEV